ncbi:MAG TPA: sulfotransferase family 2 domain-containing protein [Casimicrobiaceae bacterium]|nr:sulfotransferase family 2 domain-containing protein [Casimicrobiaceae bacterium]
MSTAAEPPSSIAPAIADRAAALAPRHDVLFVHIQKTAGISLYNAIARAYGADRSMRFARSSDAYKAQYLEMPDAELRGFRLLSGHFNLPFWQRRDLGPRVVVSVVREPVERVLSTYRYIRSWKGHRRHASAGQMSIEAFVDDYAGDTARHNVQCTRLCGKPDCAEALAAAHAHVDLLGSVEALPLLTAELAAVLGATIDVGVDNRSSVDSPRRADLDPKLVAALLACNAEDAKLWGHVTAQGVVRGHVLRDGAPAALRA